MFLDDAPAVLGLSVTYCDGQSKARCYPAENRKKTEATEILGRGAVGAVFCAGVSPALARLCLVSVYYCQEPDGTWRRNGDTVNCGEFNCLVRMRCWNNGHVSGELALGIFL